jgi:2-keto-4-pentenoate hydratase/2-oxohepta-3-ene-1,7-dioic acid hydratase in catechol pathway
MKYVTFSTSSDPSPRLGLLRGDHVLDVAAAFPGQAPGTMLALIQHGTDYEQQLRGRVERLDGSAPAHRLAEVRWHAPIPRPTKNIFCLGLNYLAHAHESGRARGKEPTIPTVPVIFTKAPTTMNGPFEDVPVDWSVTSKVDWEVELGVVIGTKGRNIHRDEARRHVFGYTVINDLSARDVQNQHLQWFKGKSLDQFCPMGPVIVTVDEFGDPHQKRLQLRVNGVIKQDSNTADMIFPIDVIIEWLSRGLTLEPGDIIATGTPEGVGMGRTPPEFLKHGDVVETEVEGVGTLRNRIVTMST